MTGGGGAQALQRLTESSSIAGGDRTQPLQRPNQDKQLNDLTLSSAAGYLPLLRRTFA